MATKSDSRRPDFLGDAVERRVTAPKFRGPAGNSAPLRAFAANAMPVPAPVADQVPGPPVSPPVTDLAPMIDHDALYLEATSRVATAVAALDAIAARLFTQAQHDTTELAFLLARRILEGEVTTRPEAIASLVRSAVRRLGESQKVLVRLSPSDADAVNAMIAEGGAAAVAGPKVAEVEVVADPSLERGDCLVEGAMGSVDGRLGTRLEQLRRALDEAAGTDGT